MPGTPDHVSLVGVRGAYLIRDWDDLENSDDSQNSTPRAHKFTSSQMADVSEATHFSVDIICCRVFR